jgi:hypothetical protein
MVGLNAQVRTRARIAARLAAALAALAAALAPAAERIAIRGTSVTLVPPPGFTASRSVRGLENDSGSTITIAERPAQAYAELAEQFSSPKRLSEGYAGQRVTIRSVRRIDGRIPFAVGRQAMNDGREITKYLALLESGRTVLVTFNIADRAFTEADAESLVRSIEIAPEPTLEERLAELPFTFRVVPPYSVAEVVPRQAVTLAVEGDDERPVIAIGRGRSQALMGEEPRVAADLLRATGGWRDAQIIEERAAPFAGGEGHVISATVEDRKAVQYLKIVPGGAYLRLFARGRASAFADAEAVIAEIASSVEPR